MPCYFPLQATFSVREDGRKNIRFSNENARLFHGGLPIVSLLDSALSLPCGKCMGCRLERSRQWAVRIMHEAKMYENNTFLTLTFDDDNLAVMCPNGSLDKSHMQKFIRDLRWNIIPEVFRTRKNSRKRKVWIKENKIRYYLCGEYGEQTNRPHYHVCLFNYDFEDKEYFKTVNGSDYYTSKFLKEIWPYGNNIIGELTLESAGYVARYCTKKLSGDMAVKEYDKRIPPFSLSSLKPGIGASWLDKYGKSDCFIHDEIVVNGVKCKPPRYYDKCLERLDSDLYLDNKKKRIESSLLRLDDNTYSRLQVKRQVKEGKFKLLKRNLG